MSSIATPVNNNLSSKELVIGETRDELIQVR